MKKPIVVLLLILVAGVFAFCFSHYQRQQGARGPLVDDMPELTWLKNELKLSDVQFSRISDLHAAYRPKCVEMCRRISEAHAKMDTLAKTGKTMSPDLDAALKEHAAVHLECQEAMLTHIYQTAAVLDAKQSARYLEVVLPYALDFSHSEPKSEHPH